MSDQGATKLWTPKSEDISSSQMTAFMARAAEVYGLQISGAAITDWETLWKWSITHPEQFWSLLWSFTGVRAAEQGSTILTTGDIATTRFFPEARLNYAQTLLEGAADLDEAIVFHGEMNIRRVMSGRDLLSCVAHLRGLMVAAGVTTGDQVAAITANLPEAIAAALAAASLGASWASCSPDFGVSAILERFQQIKPKVLFATNGYSYNGKWFSSHAGEVASRLETIEATLWCDYETGEITASGLADKPMPQNEAAEFVYEQLPFDHPLYIMFSSGTTGPPKCMIHGAGGTMLQHLKEHQLHVDLRPRDRLLFFTTCGWMMWNWVVSALGSRCSLVLYDGSPLYPKPERLFDIVAAERVTAFGISARYIESTFKAGLKPAESHDLSALRVVMSTGSPLAPHCFDHVYQDWKQDLRLSSMSGGTDIVGCFVTGHPNLPVYRGEIQCPALGIDVQIFDENGRPQQVENGISKPGELVCASPHPSQPIGFLNDPDGARYRAAYFETFPNVWHHGDWCQWTQTGGLIIYGRSDATLNPGGVRIGTAEIYREVEQVSEVLEAVVIGQDIGSDTRVVLFVKLKPELALTAELEASIRMRIRQNASPRHVPALIVAVADIPRTKSGKIVELAVRNVVHGRPVKNLNALANPEALENFANLPELQD